MTKNWERALFGSAARAMETMPRLCLTELNSALTFLSEPPVPQVDEVLHVVRGHIREKADVDLAGARVQLGDLVFVVAHGPLLARGLGRLRNARRRGGRIRRHGGVGGGGGRSGGGGSGRLVAGGG